MTISQTIAVDGLSFLSKLQSLTKMRYQMTVQGNILCEIFSCITFGHFNGYLAVQKGFRLWYILVRCKARTPKIRENYCAAKPVSNYLRRAKEGRMLSVSLISMITLSRNSEQKPRWWTLVHLASNLIWVPEIHRADHVFTKPSTNNSGKQHISKIA